MFLQAGCGEPPAPGRDSSGAVFDPAAFSGASAFQEVKALVELGPRVATRPGAERAAIHLLSRFRELGLAAELEVFEDAAPGGLRTFRNVIARIPGRSARAIILGTHFDTKGGISDTFIGANDSGSSTGALLELGRVMRAAVADRELETEIIFAAFDGEEAAIRYGPRDGFHGSRRFVEQLKRTGKLPAVQAMILMDMIGDRDLYVTLPRNTTPFLARMALDAARADGSRSAFGLIPQAIGDDHVPFLEAGIPAVNLIDFAYGSAPGLNDYWHTEQDSLDKISPQSIEIVGRVVLRMVNALLEAPHPLPR
jgi:glutaminyl-peptide cyclotransferase